ILDGSLDLEPVADDPGVCQQALALLLAVPGDDGGIEVVEGFPVVLAFLQDRFPTQAPLRPFKDQELEQQAVVVDRPTPFGFMVLDVQSRLGSRASGLALLPHRSSTPSVGSFSR